MIDGIELEAICEQPSFDSRKTANRWAAQRPARLERAREALGDVAAYEIGQIVTNCTSETAAADRVKLAALEWRARGPRNYSGRHVNELVGAGGNPVAVEAGLRTLNVMAHTSEERAILKKGLLRMTGQRPDAGN